MAPAWLSGTEILDNTDYESRLPADWVPRTQGGCAYRGNVRCVREKSTPAENMRGR